MGEYLWIEYAYLYVNIDKYSLVFSKAGVAIELGSARGDRNLADYWEIGPQTIFLG